MNTIFKEKLNNKKMINKEIIINCLGDIRNLLFIGYFEELPENIDQYINQKIENIKINLISQIELLDLDAEGIVENFVKKLPTIKELLETDINAALKSDPAAESADEIILSYPGIYAITTYRIAHLLYCLNVPIIPRIMTEHAHSVTGIDIHPGATIGKSFFIDHGTGIVIGETTIIGDCVKIYQGVTLGAISLSDGSKMRGIKRHPTIKDNVTIYSGASILGGDTIINENCVIGSNVFITKSVEASKKVLLPKQQIIKKDLNIKTEN